MVVTLLGLRGPVRARVAVSLTAYTVFAGGHAPFYTGNEIIIYSAFCIFPMILFHVFPVENPTQPPGVTTFEAAFRIRIFESCSFLQCYCSCKSYRRPLHMQFRTFSALLARSYSCPIKSVTVLLVDGSCNNESVVAQVLHPRAHAMMQ